MKVSELLSVIDGLAAFALAEPWDHVGLQVGAPDDEVAAVLVALDPAEAAFDEAARRDCGALLFHHPLLFEPLAAVTGEGFVGGVVLRAARERRAVIAAHTNLDKAHGGLADVVGEALGLEGLAPLAPARMDWLKLVGFVPESDAADVASAIYAAGAGVIGDYVHCSFSVPGEGSFQPTASASPSIGKVGHDQRTGELRLEAVFPRALRRQVTDAYVAAHSYEEPAFDVYPVENEVRTLGLGRLGFVDRPRPLAEFACEVAELFGLPAARFTGDGARTVRAVACLPGSGASLIDEALGKADVLITGDVKYHDAARACREGLSLIDVPHDASEAFALERWTLRLADALAPHGVEASFFAAPRGLWSHVTLDTGIEAALAESTTMHSHADDYFHLYVDGGSRGNPGPAGVGGRLVNAGGELEEEFADTIGRATNNVAEYQAWITGLELALDHGVRKVAVYSDSELVCRQLTGQYKVKDANLRGYHDQVKRLLAVFHEAEIKCIPREENEAADRLVNEALDRLRA